MSGEIINSGIDSFENDVIKSEAPSVVYFYSEDCPHCKAFDPIFERMAESYKDKLKFVKVFRQQNRALAEKYNIRNSPTVLFIKNGAEFCSRLNGYIGKPELRQSIENVIGESCSGRVSEKVYCDVLIIGGGPAGLAAAIYSARAKLYTVVVDEGMTGGQVSTTFHVANYPGTNGVIRGTDLMENMKKQAIDFGAKIDDLKEISELSLDGIEKRVKAEDKEYYPKAIIAATGAGPRKLPADGETEFRGRGVHYCATCDGPLYQDANLLVIGGGNSAVDEAVFLTRFAKHVTIIHQFDSFQASKASQDEAFKNPNISVIWDSEVRSIHGENFVKSVTIQNVKTKEMREIETDGIFVYIGMQPKTELFKDKLRIDEAGYIVTDENMNTNLPGVFAAGDVREKKVRQIATATGDGAVAGIMAESFIKGR